MDATTLPLTHFQRRLLALLERYRHKPQGVCYATATLAEMLRCSVRYVQEGLRALRTFGLLVLRRDYGLKTRRRYFLAGAAPADCPLFDPPAIAGTNSVETNFFRRTRVR